MCSTILTLVLTAAPLAGLPPQETAKQADAKPSRPFCIAHPKRNWALEIEIRGFIGSGVQTARDGTAAKMEASNKANGAIISMFVFDAVAPGDEKFSRDYHWGRLQKAPLKFTDVKMTERDNMALNWRFAEVPGVKVKQRNVNAYLVRDGVWIDIHLSKTPAADGDDKVFETILTTVRFKEGIDPKVVNNPPGFVLFQQGSRSFTKKDYKAAIEPYRKALDLEKKERLLDDLYWRVLIDNLGMCYGITGDLDNAKAAFEYGVVEDPTYPLFHYNLACTYAEAGDLDKSLASLRIAFKHRKNVNPGEKMPDPLKDDSFKKYLDDGQFKQAIEEINP